MKYTLLVFLCTLIACAGVQIAPDHPFFAPRDSTTWEGELDPRAFSKWKAIKKLASTDPTELWITAENPDQSSQIPSIALIYKVILTAKGDKGQAILVEYRYFKAGEPYVFDYDTAENKYRKVNIPEWKRKACLYCHTDKIKPGKEVSR